MKKKQNKTKKLLPVPSAFSFYLRLVGSIIVVSLGGLPHGWMLILCGILLFLSCGLDILIEAHNASALDREEDLNPFDENEY